MDKGRLAVGLVMGAGEWVRRIVLTWPEVWGSVCVVGQYESLDESAMEFVVLVGNVTKMGRSFNVMYDRLNDRFKCQSVNIRFDQRPLSSYSIAPVAKWSDWRTDDKPNDVVRLEEVVV